MKAGAQDVIAVIKSAPFPAFAFNVETLQIFAANSRVLEVLGYEERELLSMTIDRLRPPEDLPRLRAALLREPSVSAVEWRWIRKDGQMLRVHLLWRSITFVSHSGVIEGRFVFVESSEPIGDQASSAPR